MAERKLASSWRVQHKQSGVAMLEVLISIFILAVGVLGMASLQFMSLKNSSEANRTVLAARHINELAEMIRANRTSISTYESRSGPIEFSDKALCFNNCTSLQIAEGDMAMVMNALHEAFEGGSLLIESSEFASGPGLFKTLTITLTWEQRDNRFVRETYSEGSDEAKQSYVVRVVL
ncbi:Uncharacterised protein [BD1-7 clade bacterium]|uniref:Type IV pilin Tt1218-like domain-containing protein n=1 Tax=BD1-7 clade bacterium TaxID=2029982 RepID=A0A5S9PVV1_9GAMM|nr:Uncharacterised protein [BD1-7 clade bacterium]CAA0108755.1 Uncharacterised protein [BD1-7 clade bacterium]